MRLPPLCALALLLTACDRGEVMNLHKEFDPPVEPLLLDAGTFPEDAATRPPEMPPSPDPDLCLCPAPPTACGQPLTDRPIFTPNDEVYLGQFFNLIACAEDRIRLAMFDTDLICVVDALLARLDAAPALSVEVVIDDDQCPRLSNGNLSCELDRLEMHPRATIMDDARSRYMHLKFMVADDDYVWASSANLTHRSACVDYNDALITGQPEVVSAYAAEFDRLFQTQAFGPQDPQGAVRGGPYSVYFGPQSPQASAPDWHLDLLASIDGAQTTIDVMIFAWTKVDFADAIVAAHGRGVVVRAVVSPRYIPEAPAQRLVSAGIPVRTASVHSKVMIIDGLRVVTGTPNWSNNSWKNNEASLFIEDTEIADRYLARFEVLFAEARDP